MKMLSSLALCGALVAPGLAAAAEPFPDLPPTAAVLAAIRAHPAVRGARSGVRVEESNRDRLVAGPYEYGVRIGAAQRRDAQRDYAEWDVALEKSLRLPGKARLDAQLGAQGIEQAKLGVGDALHEASREVLRTWFAVVRAGAAVREAAAQAGLLRAQFEAVKKRVAAGDAPRMELNLAQSTLDQSEAQAAQARGREQAARAEFAQLFPGIDVPAQPALLDPEPLGQDLAYWREKVLEHNHELAVARSESRRRVLLASRAQSDRTPDPTVGVRHGSERAGAEKVTGVFLMIPFAGEARAAAGSAAQAQAEAAAQREALVLRRLSAEVDSAYRTALGARDTWQRARAAALGLARNAELVARGYALGESGLAEVLTARRYASEAALSARTAGLDAAESRYRLMLDAHLLWPYDEDGPAPGK
jgi:outer membrane protein TolC